MNVKIGNGWSIESDPLNYILKQRYESKQKRTLGKIIVSEKGFYNRIEHILNAVLDKELKKSEAESLESLIDSVLETREMIHKFCSEKELGFKDLWLENQRLLEENKKLRNELEKKRG